ncbi:MAG: DUF4255 domain-containing protein [Phycisphaerae bacterium]|nr:DUF4255 domain-containing protein [Saprospiraceae bacterium]
MIAETIQFICDEINDYYDMPQPPFVAMSNVAHIEDANSNISKENVIVTLVNIEEEKTLKNGSHYVVDDDKLKKRNPTIFLNLYVLFACGHNLYPEALKNINKVIRFFQRKSVFTKENSPNSNFPSDALVNKIMLDLFTLNFEQINHLWGILGGKYTPSVLYKLRIVAIQESEMKDAAEIKEIEANANLN